MPTLTINFTPVAGASYYEVCYKRTTDTLFTCATTTSSPYIVPDAVECGSDYDVKVTTHCTNGMISTEATTIAASLECVPICYSPSIHEDDSVNTFIAYRPVGGVMTYAQVSGFSLQGQYFVSSFCSEIPVELVDSSLNPAALTSGSVIAMGASCTTNEECLSANGGSVGNEYYLYESSGLGETSCTDQTLTLFTNCSPTALGAGCIVYTDLLGTIATGNTQAYINGTLWDLNPATGMITGAADVQC